MSPDRIETEVDGRRLSLSNIDKVLYPKASFTKGALIDYYARIAPVMLPHLADRALTLRRFPNGVEGASFYEKHVPAHAPEWVRTMSVPSADAERSPRRDAEHAEIEYVVIGDRPSLIWAANLAAIELHVPLWREVDANPLPGPPDHLVFDLDPGPGTSIVECCRIGTWIRERLLVDGLSRAAAKTSGSKGLQLYAPLPRPTSWSDARDHALDIAQAIERDHPELVVTNMRKSLRNRRVLIDWSQNHAAKTTVAVYSLRARDLPTVSTPVTWDEVAACAKSGEAGDLAFVASEVLDRVERDGDLFAGVAPTATSSPKVQRPRARRK